MFYMYIFFMYSFELHWNLSIWSSQTFQIQWIKHNQISHPPVQMGLFGLNTYLILNKSDNIILNPWSSITLEKNICMFGVQSHPGLRSDSRQGTTVYISESNYQVELSTYHMCCSYVVFTNPHMKPWIQFTIMKIFMKIVKISLNSPLTVLIIMFPSGTQQRLEDRLAMAARKKLASASHERNRQVERRKKLALFLSQVKDRPQAAAAAQEGGMPGRKQQYAVFTNSISTCHLQYCSQVLFSSPMWIFWNISKYFGICKNIFPPVIYNTALKFFFPNVNILEYFRVFWNMQEYISPCHLQYCSQVFFPPNVNILEYFTHVTSASALPWARQLTVRAAVSEFRVL